MADIREDVMVDAEIALTYIDSGMIISYDELGSKPSINGVVVEGAKTSADYGLAAAGASYAKAEEDALLSAKADKADTYTKAETDAKLGIKADSGDSYTKAEEDALLSAKADKATTLSGYGITDAYTKKETDDKLDTKVNNSLFFNELDKKANKTDVDTALNTKANRGTTLKDYQIGDAYTKSEINTSLSNKQNKLTFDTIPTSGSTNPVQSGGVKSALDAKADIGSYTQVNADFTYSTSDMSDISVIGISSDVIVGDDTIFDAAEHYPYNVPTLDFLKEILITFGIDFSEAIGQKQNQITISTSAPKSTDGSNGDIWMIYEKRP